MILPLMVKLYRQRRRNFVKFKVKIWTSNN